MATFTMVNGKAVQKPEPSGSVETEGFDADLPGEEAVKPAVQTQIVRKKKTIVPNAAAEPPKIEYHIDDDDDDEDTATEPVVPEVPETTPAKPAATYTHPASLVRTARNFGITDGKIASTPTDMLDSICDTLMAQWEAQQQKQQAAPAPAKVAEVEPTDAELLDMTEEELAEWDPRVVKMHAKNARATHEAEKRNKALEAELAQVKKSEQQRAGEAMGRMVDSAFAALNSPLLGGKQPGSKLDSNSDEMERRVVVLDKLNQLKQRWTVESIKAMAKKIYGLAEPEAPTKKPKISEEEWEEAVVAKPTNRKDGPKKKGEKTAKENMAERLNQRFTPDDEDDDDGI
jgi:hypothetical protein